MNLKKVTYTLVFLIFLVGLIDVFALSSSTASKILNNFKKLEYEMIFESDGMFIDEEDKKIEQIFLGFRSVVGVSKDILNEQEIKRAEILVDEKKIYLQNETFYNLDYLLADEITLFISS